MPESTFPIEGVLRRYDWGSRTAIPRLLGIEPDGRPAAELWFGAHPGDPSPALGTTLDALIAADPQAMLADGDRLPFLLKVLAADKALSIQVHPTREQARAGFAAEERKGIPLGSPERNYADDNHKPELLCALTPFEALCGFRPVEETRSVLDELAIPELGFVADRLRGTDGLRDAFTALLTHPDARVLSDAVAAKATEHGPLRAAWLAAHDFPGDVGVVVALLLNYVRLEPGEAIFLGAGNVHAYLRGMGVEIMANSDNVLRCGLTAKHIDVPELLKITDFSELTEPQWPSENGTFSVPVPDFELRELRLGTAQLRAGRPRIVLCTEGSADVDGVRITPGHAAFVAASAEATVRGDATIFIASTATRATTKDDRPTRQTRSLRYADPGSRSRTDGPG